MITSPVTFPIKTLSLSPGSHVMIEDVSWEEYEALLEELGADRLIPRINYCHGTLELMSPLPSHERPNRIIAYIVTTILDVQNRDWEDFGSTTFKKPKQAGLEPDTCFYIENAARVRNHLRMDMAVDPPPDLAIEADVTSEAQLAAAIDKAEDALGPVDIFFSNAGLLIEGGIDTPNAAWDRNWHSNALLRTRWRGDAFPVFTVPPE